MFFMHRVDPLGMRSFKDMRVLDYSQSILEQASRCNAWAVALGEFIFIHGPCTGLLSLDCEMGYA